MKVARLYRFNARHSLPGVAGYDHEHEHRYTVEVVVSGGVYDGMVIDTRVIDEVFAPLADSLADTNLNDLVGPSTVENLAQHFARLCPPLPLQVRVWEDDGRWGEAP